MWAKQVTKDKHGQSASASVSAEPAIDDAEGYKLGDAPVPEVMPENHDAVPFLAPGPALVPLPPTEAEIKAAQNGHIQEESQAETVVPSVHDELDAQDPEMAEMIAAAEAARAARQPAEAKDTPVAFPTEAPAEGPATYADVVSEEPTEEAPAPAPAPTQEVTVPPVVAFPLSPPQLSPTPSIPVAFPSNASETSSQRLPSAAPTPSISFVPLDPPSGRNGTSGETKEDKEPKRKRISSQNFQRLARRLSLGGRKGSSSSSIPQVSPQPSTGGNEASREASIDSPPANKMTFPTASAQSTASKATPPAIATTSALAASSSAAASETQSPSESESISTSTPKAKRKQLQKKRPTRSKTTF